MSAGDPLSMDKIVSEKGACACGNTFMLDSAFCRKCGANRSGAPVYDVEKVDNWELFLDGSPTPAIKHDEPRTLLITYSSAKFGKDVEEVVYEDASECDKRPRLLVSLESVLALKALCEREFDRVEVITNILKLCRTAYFKELQYLREQLKLVTRPGFQPDGLENYEVYWYDPPEYIDTDMKVFLQDCIRLTNKKLIEENFELIQKLKALGEGAQGSGDDADIIRMIRTLGPGGFVRKLYGLLCTQEHGSVQKRKDFEIAVMELLRKEDDGDSDNDNGKLQAKLRKLQAEIDKLLKQNADSDALRKRVAELEAQLAALKGQGSSAAMEAARADAEKARADEMEAKVLQLEAEMSAMRERLKEFEGLKPAIAKLATKVDSVVSKLAPNAKPGIAASDGILSPLEVSISMLEGCIAGVMASKSGGSGSSEADRKAIAELNAQLKASQDNEAKLRAEIARLQAEAKRLKADRDAEAASAAKALAELEALRAGAGAGDSDSEALRRELRNLREANDKLSKEAEDRQRQMKDLQAQLAEADKERNKLRDKLKNAGGGNTDAMDEAMEEMQRRLAYAHDKIKDLKAIIKRLKAQLGIEDDDDDGSEDSNYDGDMPMFLMSYTKRCRTSIKPRWKHLSEDARFGRQKRDFMYAQTHASDANNGGLGQDAAAMALDFLRTKQDNRRMPEPMPRKGRTDVRSHSKVMRDENEPVQVALQAKEAVENGKQLLMSQVLANDHLQEMSNRTGHPMFRFEQIAHGEAKPVEEACLAFRGSREEQRKKLGSRERQSPPIQASSSFGAVPSAAARLKDSLGAAPPMVVLAQEQLKPVLPLRGMNDSSASHQVFNKARESSVAAALAERPVPRSVSPPQDRAVSRPGIAEARGRDVRPVAQVGGATVPQTGSAVAAPFQAVVGGGAVQQAGRSASTQRGSPGRSTATGQPGRISPTPSGRVIGMGGMLVRGVSVDADQAEGSATNSATPATGSGMNAREMMGQLQAIAASGQRPGMDQRQLPLPEAAAINAGWRQATSVQQQSEAYQAYQATPAQRQAESRRDIVVPSSPQDPQSTRSGGLLKMQTPTEWAVDSHRRSPSPPSQSPPRPGSVPVAVQRLSPTSARSRPASRETESPSVDHLGSLSPGRSQPPSPGSHRGRPSSQQGPLSPGRSQPPRQGARAAPQEVASYTTNYGPTLADMLAHPQRDPRTLVTVGATAPLESEKVSSAVTIYSSTSLHSSKRNLADPLPTEPSKESVDSGMLPLQDSITSTIASASSLHQRTGVGPKTQASRGRALNSSNGFRSATAGSATAETDLRQVSTRGATEFSPRLGFGDRPSGTAPMSQSSSSLRPAPAEGIQQMSRSCSSFHPVQMEGASPQPRRTRTAGGQRDVVWGARSAGSLPLTNAAPRHANTGALSGAPLATPLKQKRIHPGSGDDRKAKAELAAANKEGHLPELLPAFKPGKIQQKGPRPASWLVAV